MVGAALAYTGNSETRRRQHASKAGVGPNLCADDDDDGFCEHLSTKIEPKANETVCRADVVEGGVLSARRKFATP